MRIGYVFNHATIVGGGEISFIDLADAIRGCDVDPVAVVPGEGEVSDRLRALEIETVLTPFPSLRGLGILGLRAGIKRVARVFGERKLDLAHVNGARCMLYAGPAARRAGIPCVWHVRVLERDRFLDRLRTKYASAIVSNSHAVAYTLAPLTGAKRKPVVIYNGLDLDRIQQARPADLQREFGVSAGPVVLGVGRFTRRKRFEDIICASAILQEQGLVFSVLLVGKALPEEEAHEKTLKDLALRMGVRSVFFPGWRDDVVSIMKSASVFVLPSCGEAFGRVIVEAWACGLPVVAVGTGGPAELITPQVDGLVVEPINAAALADSIKRILVDRVLREGLAAQGRQRATEFSLEDHARQVMKVYCRLLDQDRTLSRRVPGNS